MKTALYPTPRLTGRGLHQRAPAPPRRPVNTAALKHWCLARADEWFYRNEHGAARDLLRYAAALDPADHEVWLALGAMHFMLGAHVEAGHAFVRAGRLRPNDARVFLFLAITHERLGDDAHAEALHRHALALQPDNPLVLAQFGAFLFLRRRYAEAREYLERALAEETSDPGLVASLGECCRRMGDQAAARACFEHVLKLAPNNEAARKGLAAVTSEAFPASRETTGL